MSGQHSSYEQIAVERRRTTEYREGYDEARCAFLIGQSVRERRLELGLSQSEVARRAGMTQPALPRLETGCSVPTIPVLDRTAAALAAELSLTITPHAAWACEFMRSLAGDHRPPRDQVVERAPFRGAVCGRHAARHRDEPAGGVVGGARGRGDDPAVRRRVGGSRRLPLDVRALIDAAVAAHEPDARRRCDHHVRLGVGHLPRAVAWKVEEGSLRSYRWRTTKDHSLDTERERERELLRARTNACAYRNRYVGVHLCLI